jgi:uncharacterized repeat protein (TIGR04138 family)
MATHHPKLEEIVRRDPRFAYEAYEFVFASLAHTQQLLDRVPPSEGTRPDQDYHVSGRELVHGIRDLAVREFGFMARTVFRMWGIDRTADFGDIVFNLIEAGLMSKTAQDDRRHFQDVFDLDEALVNQFRIELHEGAEDPS